MSSGHREQFSDPVDALYLPISQSVQGPPSGPVAPALQVQSVLPPTELASVGQTSHAAASTAPGLLLKVLTAHAVQFALPGVGLYVPAGHAVHAPPSLSVYPAAQMH